MKNILSSYEELKKILTILAKKWHFPFACLMSCILLSFVYIFFAPYWYSNSFVIMMPERVTGGEGLEGLIDVPKIKSSEVVAIDTLMALEGFKNNVVHGMQEKYPKFSKNDFTFSSSIFKKKKNILSHTIRTKDPHLSFDLAKKILSHYHAFELKRVNKKVVNTLQYIKRMLPNMEKKFSEIIEDYNKHRKHEKTLDYQKQIDAFIAQMIKKHDVLTDLYQKKAELLQKYTLQHTQIQSIDHQINYIRGEIKNFEKKVIKMPEIEKNFSSFERKIRVQEEIYLSFLKKLHEVELLRAEGDVSFIILDEPRFSDKPCAPIALYVVLFGICVGLILASAVIFVLYKFYGVVTATSDIQDACNIPIIGSIPNDAFPGIQNRSHKTHELSPLTSEAFYSICTYLSFNMKKKANAVVEVCGLSSGVGKTFNTAHLGIAWARSKNQRVLLLDADTHKQSLTSFIVPKKHENLKKNFTAFEVEKTSYTNVDLLSAPKPTRGVPFYNDSEFMSFFEKVKKNYDVIFVDTPPINLFSDAFAISLYCDTRILIVRKQKTILRNLIQLIKNHHAMTIDFDGIIFNGEVFAKDIVRDYNKYYSDYIQKNTVA